MYFIEKIELNDYILNITFSGDIVNQDIKMVLKLRDMERFLLAVFDQSFQIDVNIENGMYKAKLNLKDIIRKLRFENLNSSIIWIEILNNGVYQDLQLKSKLEKISNIELGGLCKVNLFKRKNNALGIKLTKINVSCDLNSLEISDGFIKLKVKEGYLENNNKINVNKILLKKRVFKNISKFNSYIELDRKDDYTFVLNFNDLEKFQYEEVSILEFVAQFNSDNLCVESLINMSPSISLSNSDYKKNNNSYKFYKTKKGSLAIKMTKVYSDILMENMAIEDGKVNFEINSDFVNNYDKAELSISKKVKLYDEVEYIELKKIELHRDNNIECSFNLKELFNFAATNYDQLYEVLLRVKNAGKEVLYRLYNNDKNNKNIDGIQLQTDKEFLIRINSNNKNRRKLAILGSCFSRAPFNSKDSFFNLDYKKYFEVSYTHFWFSVISLISEKVELDVNNFNDISEKELKDIVREYTKSTFFELKNTDFDYIVIDFFLDAIHGVRDLNDGRYLAINPTLNKSKYYKNYILDNSTQFDYRNENYFDVWKKSCDIFIENLKEIVGLDKVVISLGGLIEKYYDKNLEVKDFTDDNKFTKSEITIYNKLWMRMNNYFLAKAPEAKILDMSNYNYIGYDDHPVSSGPHHYESNYYKSFVGELAKIITFD